jgi:hypothetical protein
VAQASYGSSTASSFFDPVRLKKSREVRGLILGQWLGRPSGLREGKQRDKGVGLRPKIGMGFSSLFFQTSTLICIQNTLMFQNHLEILTFLKLSR